MDALVTMITVRIAGLDWIGGNVIFYTIAFGALAKAVKMSRKMKGTADTDSSQHPMVGLNGKLMPKQVPVNMATMQMSSGAQFGKGVPVVNMMNDMIMQQKPLQMQP